jgi:hypothetical protein
MKARASAPTFTDPVMNLIFQLLRDYTYPADEGKVDMTNIYKVLYTAGSYMTNAAASSAPIAPVADSAIASYAFSDFLGHTYDSKEAGAESGGYGHSTAYHQNGGDKYTLSSYKWAPDAAQQIAIGAIQSYMSTTTNEVELTFAQTVNYPANSSMGGTAGGGFATRTHIAGNSGTHAFELKIAMVTASGFTKLSLVGKGVSQGAGQYFLVKNGVDYYCIPAGAADADLMSITPTTQPAVSPNCTAYVAGVDALVPYDVNNAAEIPNIDLSSFDLGVAGSPVKYLIGSPGQIPRRLRRMFQMKTVPIPRCLRRGS